MTPETKNLIKLICAIASVAVVLIAVLILIGTFSGSGITEVPSNTFNPVDPNANETIAPNETRVKLYFRYLDTDMLAAETRTIQSYANQRVELAVLRALLSGPSQGRGLTRVIDSQTRVVSVNDEGDTLIVTFSEEFLRNSSNLPDGWGEDAALREEEYLRKRLAVHSVVNTLAGMGDYSHVQILIDFNNSGIGQKVNRSSFGFVEDAQNKNRPLQPLAFNESVSLTARNTVDAVMRALIAHDWQTVYLFLS
ncbi:MAG: GerMN domain-containing protein, partial [Christensenellales bacterium]